MSSAHKTVLMIEDNPADAEVIREELAMAHGVNFTIETANNLADGLSYIEDHPVVSILLDLSLPDSHGLETVKRTREKSPTIPIIVLTGHEDEEMGLAALREGAQDYIIKGHLNGAGLARTIEYAVERKMMEEKLHRAKHLDAMTNMSAALVNDFNNILSVILIKLQSLEWPLRHDDTMLREINDARDAVFRGVSHMNKLSSFSRLEPYVPENVDLNQCITKRAALLGDVAGRGCKVITKLDTSIMPACIDPLDLEMALINLFTNARDSMSGGGSITISTENKVIAEGDYAENDIGPGNYVVLSVTDIGVGMSEKERKYATEPHFSTKPDAAGRGFGLSMVFSFMRQSKGFMHIESKQGSGTSIKLFLPAVSANTKTAIETADPLTVLTKSETVLVIEGDAGVRKAMAKQLGDMGYAILQAGSPVQALEILEANPETDLVMMDIFLSDNIDCATLAKEIIDSQPGIKILYTSTHARTAFKHIGVPDGIEDVLFKPYRRSKLAQKLREMLDDKVNEPALV